ncbi:MAG: DUF3048 domain-containing protein [Candidatus Limivivens sp.]|nr:DUF3048 domain-containing protein [Candidatus Limivivens sp.]
MKKLIVAALLSIAVFSLTGCGSDAGIQKTEVADKGVAEDIISVTSDQQTGEKQEDAQENAADTTSEMSRSTLTGQLVEEEVAIRRPIAIMLNNIIDACPQAGIAQAGVVYEAPVEGLLTRLMGIFETYDLDKIGSVRSCRDYYIDFAQEFDAIYVHYGQAVYAVSKLNAPGIDNISGLQYQEGVGELDGYCGEDIFYRTSDRVAPHNCYTSYDQIQTAIDRLEFRDLHYAGFTGHYQFAADGETVVPTTGEALKMAPGYPVNSPWFEYNAEEGVYYRYQYGSAQIDELTGEQLKYDNVIFQVCACENYDDHGYLKFDTKSGGDAYYFTKGAYQKCTWTTDEPDVYSSPARYYDENGNEIVLNQGKTWVCIIRQAGAGDITIG